MKEIAKVSELPEGAQKRFELNGKPALIFNYKGSIKCFVNICTHAQAQTYLEEDQLTCELHASHFNPETGERTAGPAPEGSRLDPIPLKIEGDSILA